MNRRDFAKLTAAALGGLLAGAGLTEGAAKKPKKKDPKKPLFLQEPHVCRGLNTCKGKGKGGKNDCAGQGACATAKAHTCGGDNDCAGLGGCGEHPGENACTPSPGTTRTTLHAHVLPSVTGSAVSSAKGMAASICHTPGPLWTATNHFGFQLKSPQQSSQVQPRWSICR